MNVMVATPHVMLPKAKQYHASTIISENIYLGKHVGLKQQHLILVQKLITKRH